MNDVAIDTETNGAETRDAQSDSISILLRQAEAAMQYSTDEKELLVLKNMRLVVFIARKFETSVSLEDLVQAGNIGLIKAAERHDPQKSQFQTYAAIWIKQSIRMEISKTCRDIRLPTNLISIRRKIRNVATELEMVLGRKPTLVEIVMESGFRPDQVTEAFENRGTVKISMDSNVLNHEDLKVNNLIPDENTPRPDEVLMSKESIEDVDRMSKQLDDLNVSDRQKQVFRHHHNLNSNPKIYRTLESTAEAFGITRERVRQIVKNVSKSIASKTGNNPSVPLPNKKRRRFKFEPDHIRSSPAFANWKPENVSDRISASISFVTYAYELTNAQIFSHDKRRDIVWARDLSALIMLEECALPPEEIEESFLGYLDPVELVIFRIDHVLNNDPVVRKDVEALRLHFQSVMGL